MSGSADTPARLTPYDIIGSEKGVRHLVERFYDIMENDPAMAELRAMHEDDLAPMRERLYEFLSGWLGGPRLYDDCVMSAHAPLAIGPEERGQWIACMNRAMEEIDLPEAIQTLLGAAFTRMAGAMGRRD